MSKFARNVKPFNKDWHLTADTNAASHKSVALASYLRWQVTKHQSLTLKVAEVCSMHANVCHSVSTSNVDMKPSDSNYKKFLHPL